MIEFNLTLIAQLVNFVITLFVLRRYLFTPIIQRLLDKKQEERTLREEIVLKKRDVENFNLEKTAQLSQFQRDATSDFPFTPLENDIKAPAKIDDPVVDITPETYDELKRQLERKIQHGH